jgi:hypothetical protein
MNLFKFEPIIVDNSKIPSYFEFMNNDALSLMLFPYIFVRSKKELENKTDYDYREIINHEKIHFQQCKELFVIGFYFMFMFEWFINLIKKFSLWEAYLCIRFEQEAYENMTNFDYLKKREPYSFTRYNIFPDDSFSISNSSSEESETNNDTDTDNESNTSPMEKTNLNPITLKIEDNIIKSEPVFKEDISCDTNEGSCPCNDNDNNTEDNETTETVLCETKCEEPCPCNDNDNTVDDENIDIININESNADNTEDTNNIIEKHDQDDNSSTNTNRISEDSIGYEEQNTPDENLSEVFKRNTENSPNIHTSENPVFNRSLK